jgi:hypothetical protein
MSFSYQWIEPVFPQLLLAAGAPTAAFDSQAPPLQNLSSFSKMVRMFSAAALRLATGHPHLVYAPFTGVFQLPHIQHIPPVCLGRQTGFSGN